MPESLNVVRLSEHERETLISGIKPAVARAVAEEISATLKNAAGPVRAAAKTPDLDVTALRQARDALERNRQLLEVLPRGENVTTAAEETDHALEIIDEGLGLLNTDQEPTARTPRQPVASPG